MSSAARAGRARALPGSGLPVLRRRRVPAARSQGGPGHEPAAGQVPPGSAQPHGGAGRLAAVSPYRQAGAAVTEAPATAEARHNRAMAGEEEALRILLVDDHRVVRAGLRMLLEAEEGLEVVDEAGDVRTAVFKARRHTPDLIVLDVMRPDGAGVERIEKLHAEAPHAKVLVLSMEDSPHHVRRAFGNGANGYV